MANTITGKIYKVYPTETREYNGKTYHERNIVIDNTKIDQYTGKQQYSNFPMLLFGGEDKCRDLDNFNLGEIVTISFEVSGVKYNDKATGEEKFFNKVKAYKIERYVSNNEFHSELPKPGTDNFPSSANDDNFDLPF